MTQENTIQQSLIHAQLNSKMVDLLCRALMKNNNDLIKNKTEKARHEIYLRTNLDSFCDYIIIEGFSKMDSSNRINFTLNLLTYNSKLIAKTEMIFNTNNMYEEGSFFTENEHLISEDLVKILDSNIKFISKNIF